MRAHRNVFSGLFIAATLAATAAVAAPAKEPSRDEVVATQLLPRSVKQSLQRLVVKSDSELSAPQRLATVQSLIEAGRSTGDPRTLGYAEAMLAVWPATGRDTPTDALVLRATIEQSRHNFDAARTLLDDVLAREPQHAQALLTRSTIAQVTGDHAAARRDCTSLRARNVDAAAICAASVDVLTGQLDSATNVLRIAATRTDGALRGWVLATLAQAHEQRGERHLAIAAYRTALSADNDLTTQLAYADALLDAGSIAEADSLLRTAPPSDGVLLRQWRIARALKRNESELSERLRARFSAAAQRTASGDLLHARESALFALDEGRAADALRLARENWRQQRELADALLLARAARAARDAAALSEIRTWIASTGLRDVRIDAALRGN